MKKNQFGVSLVEVLAIIVLTSIVLIIVWSVFFQGTNYSNKSISKSFMQQEANVIVTKLKKHHQTLESYKIKEDKCSFKLTKTTDELIEEFKSDKLCIVLIPLDLLPEKIEPANVNKGTKNSLDFTLFITDKKNIEDDAALIDRNNLIDKSKYLNIDLSLHRLKEEGVTP